MSRKLVSLLLALGLLFINLFFAPAFAQNGIEGNTTGQIAYKTQYQKLNADADNSVTVQSEHHLYRPGDTVVITGSVSGQTREETDSDTVDVKIMDTTGEVVREQKVELDADGNYSVKFDLPSDAHGGYSVGSKLEVDASILGILDAELVAKLESSTTFAVASSETFNITVENEGSFEVQIATNSTVNQVELKQEEKMVTFVVEGETGTSGVTQVTIPKAMLSGEMTVIIDGQVVSPDSDDIIVTSNTNTETTFEINYRHSEHQVGVTGTNVVPEFPLVSIVMAGTIALILTVFVVSKRKGIWV